MMILDLPTLPLQPLADRYQYSLYNNVFTMTKYNDTFTMIVCSVAHLKTSCDKLLATVIHLGFFSFHATLCCTFFALLPQKVWSFAALDNTRTSFFLPSRISILNLVYICYSSSPICAFRFSSSHLSILSNATGLTQFGLFKREICPISHNDLIMEWFSRTNL